MVKASIEANLLPSDPVSIKASENKMMYAVVGLGILVAGVYIIKNK